MKSVALIAFTAMIGGCALGSEDNATEDRGCTTSTECDDGDEKTEDACLAGGLCHHTWRESPESPDRQDATFLCEERVRTSCETGPAVEVDTFTCKNQFNVGASTDWMNGGYPFKLFTLQSKMPAVNVRVLLTLRVGVYADRWVVYDLAKGVEVATLSAAELDSDALEFKLESGAEASSLEFDLHPDGQPKGRALQFSIEGLEDLATGIRYTTGCDGEPWSAYGIFARIPVHGILTLGEDADGNGSCVGEPRATDENEPQWGEFVRTMSDDRLYLISSEDGSKRPMSFVPDDLGNWLFDSGLDPAIFCAAELRVLPDGALDALPTGPAITS